MTTAQLLDKLATESKTHVRLTTTDGSFWSRWHHNVSRDSKVTRLSVYSLELGDHTLWLTEGTPAMARAFLRKLLAEKPMW